MKNKYYLTTALLTVVCASTSIISSCSEDDDSPFANTNDIYFTVSGITDGHDFVDLGLPSGTLWATCNVGAKSPEEYGDYFAWGETNSYGTSKTKSDWGNYKYCEGSYNNLNKYCCDTIHGYRSPVDGKLFADYKTELERTDDAAAANWGINWKMPSREQFEELINNENTTSKWVLKNGKYGRLIVSKKNGNCLYLPACASINSSDYNHKFYWYYWSRTIDEQNSYYAYYLYFCNDSINTWSFNRDYAISVRPVIKTYDAFINGIYYNLSEDEATVTYKDKKYNSYSGTVKIPESITYDNDKIYSVTCIGDSAFYGCSSLTSITIPESVTSIGIDAFSGTAWFNNQPDGLIYAGKVAYNYKGRIPTHITIKEGTLGIAGGAFYDCSGLTSITIPNSMTRIGSYAFSGCSGLKDVYCYATNPPSTCSDIFDKTPISSATLHVPAGSVDAYRATSPWSGFGTIVAIE